MEATEDLIMISWNDGRVGTLSQQRIQSEVPFPTEPLIILQVSHNLDTGIQVLTQISWCKHRYPGIDTGILA